MSRANIGEGGAVFAGSASGDQTLDDLVAKRRDVLRPEAEVGQAQHFALIHRDAAEHLGEIFAKPDTRKELLGLAESSLLAHALRIWRYFNQFGGESHNFLIPDNVEEKGMKEAGVDKIVFDFQDPNGDLAAQTAQIEDFVSKKVDLVTIVPIDSTAAEAEGRLVTGAHVTPRRAGRRRSPRGGSRAGLCVFIFLARMVRVI